MGKKQRRKNGSLLTKLLLTILPLVAVSVFGVMAVGVVNLNDQLNTAINRSMQEEAATHTSEISGWASEVIQYLSVVTMTIENGDYKAESKELLDYLENTLGLHAACPNGVYGGSEDGTYIDGSGWVPGADYIVKERGWYKEGLAHDTVQFGEPYLDADTGEMVVSATVLLKNIDKKNMVMSSDVFLSEITDIISELKVMNTESGYGFLVDKATSTIIAHKDNSFNARVISATDSDPFLAEMTRIMNTADGSVREKEIDGVSYFVTLTPIEHTGWVLITSVLKEEALQDLYDLIRVYMIIGFVSILVVSLVVARVIISSIKPVKKLTNHLIQIAEGDFTVDIEVKGNDEIAQMSLAMKQYIQVMKGVIETINGISDELNSNASNSKVSSEILSHTADEQQKSMQSMQSAVNELARSVTELAHDATSLAQIVDVTNKEGSEAGERMRNTVSITKEGHRDMLEIQQVMKKMVASMEELAVVVEEVGKSTDEINEIMKLIEDIASQTNLLSLNASIEAARAGEAGRGFAVVAGEIGHLAEGSTKSVHKVGEIVNTINAHVASMVNKTRQSVSAINANASSINKACDTFDMIVEDIGSTNEAIENIMGRIANVDQVASNMAAISEEQSASAEEVLATIEVLAENSLKITEESKGVEKNSVIVADSANVLVENMKFFKV